MTHKEKDMSKNKNPIQVLIGTAEQALLLTIALATIGAAIIEVVRILSMMSVNLSDLFLLFIYAEVLGMVGVYYKENRISVTLPIIIAITALTRLIVLHNKGLDAINIIYEASGILLLAIAVYIISKKEELSLNKQVHKKKDQEI
jgi:protein PsiE